MASTTEERAIVAQVANAAGWAKITPAARAARTAPATAAHVAAMAKRRAELLEQFAQEIDPEGLLEPADRLRRAESARKAHYGRLKLTAMVNRRKAKETTTTAEIAEAQLAYLGDPQL